MGFVSEDISVTDAPDEAAQTALVIGAGRHGGTGSRVVEQLLAHRYRVRVLVRTASTNAERLRRQGAQIVFGDLLDRRTLGAAIDGVDAVYFAYPVAAGATAAAANLASVLRAASRTPHVVVMSMGPSSADNPSALGRAQFVAEEVFSWAGLDPTVLKVTALFYENILILHGSSIRATGTFANNFGAADAPWISGRDAADLAVAALVHPDRYPATKITWAPGAELLSHDEVAKLITAEIDSPVKYRPISQEQWRANLEDIAGTGDHVVNYAMAQHISSIGAAFSRGAAPTIAPNPTHLQEVIQHEPMSFADFVHANRDQFLRQ